MVAELNYNAKNDDFLYKINHLDERLLSPIAKSVSVISPGDVLRFTYSYLNKSGISVVGFYHVLVVNPGRFTHPSTGNRLMTCYKLDGLGETVLKTSLSHIYTMKRPQQQEMTTYKDKEKLLELKRTPYQTTDETLFHELLKLSQSLRSLFGYYSYRTFDLKKIVGGLEKINIDPNRLESEDQTSTTEIRERDLDPDLKEFEDKL
jgi:hypothetical protein